MKRHIAFWWWNRAICNLCQYTIGQGNNHVSVGDNLPTNSPKHPYCSEQLMETMLWNVLWLEVTEQNSTSSLHFTTLGAQICKWSLSILSWTVWLFIPAYLARARMFCMENEWNFSSEMRTIVSTPSPAGIRIVSFVPFLLDQVQNAGTSWELITRYRSRRSFNGRQYSW